MNEQAFPRPHSGDADESSSPGAEAFDIGDVDPFYDGGASAQFLLEKSAEHRRRMEKLRELLLSEGHYGDGATPSVEM